MPGDYARILFKLAEAMDARAQIGSPKSTAEREGAEQLLALRRSELGISLNIVGEAAYDRLVYILWR